MRAYLITLGFCYFLVVGIVHKAVGQYSDTFELNLTGSRILPIELLESVYSNSIGSVDYLSFNTSVVILKDRLLILLDEAGRIDTINIVSNFNQPKLRRLAEVRGIQIDITGHIHVISFHGYGRFYYQKFNAEGEVLSQVKIKNLRLDKTNYNQIVNGYFNRVIQFHNKNIVLPLRQKEGGWSPDSADVCTWLHNQKDQLFGVFDKKGKLINVFGRFDSIYQTVPCASYAEGYMTVPIQNDQWLVQQVLSPKMHIYALEGDLLRTFGKPGKYANPPETYPSYGSYVDQLAYDLQYKLETPQYGPVYVDSVMGFILRFYKPAVDDTTTIDPLYLEDIQAYLNQELEMCPVDLRRPTEYQMLRDKPVYIQFYSMDLNYLGEFRLPNNASTTISSFDETGFWVLDKNWRDNVAEGLTLFKIAYPSAWVE